jgi:hypothetical protein
MRTALFLSAYPSTLIMVKESPPTLDPTDAVRPCISVARISTSFSGEPLDKTVRNWKTWSSKICDNLAICGLGNHIKEVKAGSRTPTLLRILLFNQSHMTIGPLMTAWRAPTFALIVHH